MFFNLSSIGSPSGPTAGDLLGPAFFTSELLVKSIYIIYRIKCNVLTIWDEIHMPWSYPSSLSSLFIIGGTNLLLRPLLVPSDFLLVPYAGAEMARSPPPLPLLYFFWLSIAWWPIKTLIIFQSVLQKIWQQGAYNDLFLNSTRSIWNNLENVHTNCSFAVLKQDGTWLNSSSSS